MARAASTAALTLLLLLGASARGGTEDDFRLEDGLHDSDKKLTPKTPTRKKPSGDFDLSDALPGAGEDEKLGGKQPKADPRPPRPPGGTDTIDDRDLEDVAGRGGPGGGAEPEASPQGLVPGVIAAVVAAVVGAVSSFVAYQKKRLCFRDGGSAPV